MLSAPALTVETASPGKDWRAATQARHLGATAHAPSPGPLGARPVRSVLFLAGFLLMWLSVTPFRDLANPNLAGPSEQGNLANQLAMLLFTTSLVAYVVVYERNIVLTMITPLLMATLGWFALSVLVSYEPMLASRRMLLAVFTIFNASAVLMLPDDSRHFARLLAWAAVILLVLCYLSIAVMPERAIHQSRDLLGEDLIGDWRGAFAHKNSAGAAMVILIFIGIFVARSLNRVLGTGIVVSSAVFLYYTHAKSPIVLLPAVIVVSFGLMWFRGAAARTLTVLCFTGFFVLITIGSVSFKPVHDVLGAVMKDVTFTGRDEIWLFTLAHISERPFVGFGFEAFWGTSRLLEAGAVNEWVAHTSDAHNSILNLTVTTGIVGAALALSWIVIQTIVDYVRTPPGAGDIHMSRLFLQVWLFGLSISSFESVFFIGGSLVWFMVLMSMAGMRFQRHVAGQSHAVA